MRNSFWKDRPVLITGVTGLLGGWLLNRISESGADAVCIVRDWVPGSEAVRSGLLESSRVARGDVTDQPFLERVINEYEVETVFHLAAQTIVTVANRNPVSTFESNIKGTWSVLEACRRCPSVRQIVVASSDKAYGSQPKLPYDESMPLTGRHPYDVSKSCADLLAQSYARTYGLPVAVSRCGNLFGGGDLNWNRIIPGTIRSVIRGKRPIIRSDGKFVRDYIYVEDAVAALVTLVEKLSAKPALAGEAFNFSVERPMTVLDLTRLILKLMNSKLKPVVKNEASNEIRRQYLSSKKAARLLGWKPAIGLEPGLRRAIGWYQAYFSS
ncbi:NAD-dependent epimerase/dehydratase family protein [bacterium]|nr:NAD-dependent epimerase/dehydratase family protein [bacterium]